MRDDLRDYIAARKLADLWLTRGDVEESRLQTVDGISRVSVVDRFGHETVLCLWKLGEK